MAPTQEIHTWSFFLGYLSLTSFNNIFITGEEVGNGNVKHIVMKACYRIIKQCIISKLIQFPFLYSTIFSQGSCSVTEFGGLIGKIKIRKAEG